MKRFFKLIMTAIIVVVFCIIFFFWASSPTLSEKEHSELITNNYQQNIDTDSIYSIVSYNIGHLSGLYTDTSFKSKPFYENNFNSAAKLFDSIKPDIIAFQDIDFNSDRSYKINQSYEFAKLGYNYAADAVYWNKTYIPSPYWPISKQTGKVISGQSILSKFLIKEQERIVLQNNIQLPFYKKSFYQDRIVQIAKLIIEDKTVIIINIHLEGTSKSARTIQFNYVLDLFKKYAASYPTILLGDFNSFVNKKDAVINQLFEMPDVGYSKYKKLDHIFFNKGSIEIVNSHILDEFETIASHVPIFMEFKLK